MTAELLGKLVPVSIQYPKSDPTIKFQCKVTKKKNSELFIYVVGKVEMRFFFPFFFLVCDVSSEMRAVGVTSVGKEGIIYTFGHIGFSAIIVIAIPYTSPFFYIRNITSLEVARI